MRFTSRSFFYIIKILIIIFTVSIISLIFLNYTKLIFKKGINTELKEHAGYFLDSIIITKNYILRKIDIKSNQKSKIPKIDLVIENQSLSQSIIDSSNNNNKRKYYKAEIIYPDGINRKIQFRVRGANSWHWDKEKPSLRIKTKKKFPLNLHRHLNLISPEDILMISNPFGEELARSFGLLAQNTQMVDLFINKKYVGVYQLLNREDESFLRYNKRFPGPIYNGDSLSRKWVAEDFKIYGDTSILEKINPMQYLTDALNQKISSNQLNNLWNIVDKDKLASFSALMALTAGTHSNFHHNQNFYFDPTLGKIEPVISDMNILGLLLKPGGKHRYINRETNPLDIYSKKNSLPYFSIPIYEKITPILDLAFSDPTFFYLRNKKIYNALKSFGSSENQISLLNKMIDSIHDSVLADPNKGSLVNSFSGYMRFPYSNKDFIKEKKVVENFIKNRNKFLLNELNNLTVSIEKDKIIDDNVFFKIIVDGESAVILDLKKLLKFEDISYKNSLKYDSFTSNKLILYPNLVRSYSEEVQTDILKRNLLGDNRFKEYTFKSFPNSYEFKTSKKNFNILIKNKNNFFKNAITGKKVLFNNINYDLDNNKIHTNKFKINFIKENKKIYLGPGKVIVSKNININKNETLIIYPGTDLQLGKNISIFSKGKIIAEGTTNKPITISPLEEQWGVFALVGNNTKDSIFKNIKIVGGSIDTINNIHFTGMLSFHHVPFAELSNIKLEKNFFGDDTLRAISSKINIKNIEVKNCNGDCIDFDYSNGKISNIKMEDAGNDGLDFMTSNVHVNQYKINKCGDKGMSLGENSNITGSKIEINDCEIGIASKDKSIGYFDDVLISNSNIALTTYVKNWRYGIPGIIKINKRKFVNNQSNEKFETGNYIKLKEEDYFNKLFW